ncbi:MAG: substrate-binding domain-containing protein [Acidimicrobiales bacterium]
MGAGPSRRVEGRLVATELPRGAGALSSLLRADGLLLMPAGAEGRHADTEVEVRLLTDLDGIENTIVVIGSNDLALDLAASALRSLNERLTLAVSNLGSLGGLEALRDGLCHLAGSDLLDPETGEHTLGHLDQVLPGRDVAAVRLVGREQGLIVAPGNPLALRGIEDLARAGLRYVNRQPGSGTRALVDYELSRLGIPPASITGYEREEHTHLAVPASVGSGRFDCGLGVAAAARAFGLGFVPVRRGPYDLVMNTTSLEDPSSGRSGTSCRRTTSELPCRRWVATTPRRWESGFSDRRAAGSRRAVSNQPGRRLSVGARVKRARQVARRSRRTGHRRP